MSYVDREDRIPTLPLVIATLFGGAIGGALLGALVCVLTDPVPDTEELWLTVTLCSAGATGFALFGGIPVALTMLTDRAASWWHWLGAGVGGGAMATILLFLIYGGVLLDVTRDARVALLLLPATAIACAVISAVFARLLLCVWLRLADRL